MTLQGAIKQLHELRCNEDMPVYFKPAIAEVINVLLMDVQEIRHGHWTLIDKGHHFYDWECSICGGSGRGDYLICPWCGAKMEAECENESR